MRWVYLIFFCIPGMEKDTFVLENSYIRAEINKNGQVTSLVLADQPDQDVFRTPDGSQCAGNQLMIYDDIPLYWDAWDTMDYYLETAKILNEKQVGGAIVLIRADFFLFFSFLYH